MITLPPLLREAVCVCHTGLFDVIGGTMAVNFFLSGLYLVANI